MISGKILIDAVRNLLFFIDSIVYSFIPLLYRLILYLANVDLFTGNIPIQGLIRRIYIIVGVFMLFRLSFSIMNYIIDPDAFSDQSKGFSNMVKRVLIAIVLLVSIPWFFGEAYMLQAKILTSGVLERLILGETGENSDNIEEAIEVSAKDLQFLIFSPFFHLNYNSGGTQIADSSGDLSECKPSEDAPSTHILGSADMANSECFDTLAELMDKDPDVESSGVNLYSFFRFEDDNGNIQDYRKFDSFGGLVTWTLSDGEYAIKYRAIFSTIFGGYLVFLLLSFCIDVAARAIRLLFLQILSPVAIISSIDPTSSGDRLKEWAKECLRVWASLFLRLSIIFIMMQLVRIITNSVYSGELFYQNSGYKLSGNGDIIFWIFIFLILGVFQIANKIPDLIEKATGIKASGELQLNPFKNPWVASATGLGLAGAGMIGANTYAFGKKLASSISDFKTDGGFEAFKGSMGDYLNLRADSAKQMFGVLSGQRTLKEAKNNMRQNKIARKNTVFAKSLHGAGQVGSSFLGIFAGAASGAVRGATSSYGKSLSGSLEAAASSINKAADKRNERDIRAEANQEAVLRGDKKPYTVRTRLENAMDNFASVKSSKDHGVGLYSEKVKTAQMDLTNLKSLLSRTVEGLADARLRYDGAGIKDANIENLMDQLDELIKTGSPEERKKWADSIGTAVGSARLSGDQRSIVESVASTVTRMDSLTDAVRAKEKEISKMNDIANNNTKGNN